MNGALPDSTATVSLRATSDTGSADRYCGAKVRAARTTEGGLRPGAPARGCGARSAPGFCGPPGSRSLRPLMVREHLPCFVPPMLARSGTPTDAEAWAHEVKFDGMRAQVRLDRGELCVRSRPGRDCTEAFPELAPLSAAFRKRRLLLDGELVC